MKRPALLFALVLALHLAGLTAAVSLSSAPLPAPVAKAIEGVIIPVPTPPAPPAIEPPKPKPLIPEKKPEPPKPKAAKPKPVKAKPKPVPKPVPVAAASERAVSAPEPGESKPDQTPAPVAPVKTAEPEPSSTPPVASANKAVNKAPVYPKLSRQLKEQGTVVLDVLVLKTGKVGQLKVKTSSGYPRLDQAAVNAVRHWTYSPAKELGQPVDLWFAQPVVFQLNPAAKS
ncbi:energy transducer TonB [Rheinheimera sp.]|uniref:energy transducer TonB n=1 Tax=Rheinheimera sp. TaxID=1869214 RepID=UPI00307DAC00